MMMKTVKMIALLQMLAALVLLIAIVPLHRMTAHGTARAEQALAESAVLLDQSRQVYRFTAENLAAMQQSLQKLGATLHTAGENLQNCGKAMETLGERWYVIIGEEALHQSASVLKDAGSTTGTIAGAVSSQAEVMLEYDRSARPPTEAALDAAVLQLGEVRTALHETPSLLPWLVSGLLSVLALFLGGNGLVLWLLGGKYPQKAAE